MDGMRDGHWNRRTGTWQPFREFVGPSAINITLRGGPWANATVRVDSLDPIKVIFYPGTQTAHAYTHQSDGVYLYSPDLSAEFSRDFGHLYETWGNTSYHLGTEG